MKLINDTKMKIGWFVNKIHPYPLSSTFLVKGTFDLHPGGEATLSAKQENLNGDVPGPDGDLAYPSDFAWFKPRTDVLLSGTCYSRGGKPTPVSRVTFQVGQWSKQLVVIGNRTRQRKLKIFSTASEPEPFEKMKLSYARSYGGEKYRLNPIGRGHRDGDNPFPNLVEPDQVVTTHTSRPQPAGFGAIPPAWLQRTHGQGTYGNRWEKERWPGFPADYDWSMQNAAPYDQQLLSRLKGDEKLFFENMHPEHAIYETRLPGIRTRWFLKEELPKGPRFREIKLEPDTLWVDMDAEKLVLLWRGVADIRNKRMPEILEQFILTEPHDAPRRSLDDFAQRLEKRKAEEAEAREVPAPEIPEVVLPAVKAPDMSWRKSFDEKIAKMKAEMADLREFGKSKAEKFKQNISAKGGAAAIVDSPQKSDLQGAYKKATDTFEKMKKLMPQHKNRNLPSWEKVQELMKPKKLTPPQTPAPPEVDMEPEPWTRERCAAHAKAGGSFDGEDLRGLDLSEMGFEGLSFQNALLTKANLARSRFTEADLSRADLSEADLSEADLSGANLQNAHLEKTKLPKARLSDARLEGADFSKSVMPGAQLLRTRGKRTSFFEANLEGANFSRAILPSADFGSANLARAVCVEANFEGSRAGGATATEINLEDANLTGFRANSGADFSKANLKKIMAPRSIWEDAVLHEADLREATLSSANFFRTSFDRTNMSLCKMGKARLNEAKIVRSTFLKTNLLQSDLGGATLTQSDFGGANLFRAELFNAEIRGSSFQNANLGGTKLA